jgi:transposase
MGAGRPRGSFGEKRGKALALIAAGYRQFEVARQLGVTKQAVSLWCKGATVKAFGDSTGTQLTGEQIKELKAILRRRQTDGKWSSAHIAEIIRKRFGVSYAPKSAYYVLRRIGWRHMSKPPDRSHRSGPRFMWHPPDRSRPPLKNRKRARLFADERAPKLTDAQLRRLDEILRQGPQAAGYADGDWSGRRVGELIERQFGVHYAPSNAVKLMRRMGWERRGAVEEGHFQQQQQ